MKTTVWQPEDQRSTAKAFTLVEVIIALAIMSLMISGIVSGYVVSALRAEWSAFSLAAHSLALQKLEQTRAAKWDPQGWPPVDELVSSNFPVTVDVLDVPISGTNILYATSTTTITTVSTSPPLRSIRVDTVWPFMQRGSFTNTIVTYRAPDQ
ncbi:MAG: type II secretion system protein [Verrucomicrobia bacterium]|nr:type II secretion system protein [Verrucomicrobiota bacterium]